MSAQVYLANRIVSGRIRDAQDAVQLRDIELARRSLRVRRISRTR